ncbi:tumor necrosis factor receptor superfamily member 12A [Kryptolebias marmoratus]|uniref:tumor necrosis factor receptor superfamily member 12A n=1 Tax=Kryptolebias marmoratus TaxID=37003 RepID=UPI0007F88CAB|nr:tumor necrosis factor receptor superfamily member 12A [Kryptolebias marmoratus]XP_017273740.1 tumor necrosis factor receptor superfamily member 12A [Kryptolebias marmoratus]
MASTLLCGLLLATVTGLYGASAEKSQCHITEFWSSDLGVCVPCATCKQYPKTPSCNTCKAVEERPDVWKLAAITSFSVLAVVLIGAALIIGVMVHRRKSHKRPLREPIEETAGPLYQA